MCSGRCCRPRCAGTRDRADRHQGDRRADAADGRRGPQPQPGRHPDVPARAAARPDRVRRARPPTSPRPRRFIGGNDHFFLNLGMPACKLATDAARDVPGSSLVVAMARNGTDFGIQVSGTGDQWFTGPANTPEGLFLGVVRPGRRQPRHRRLGDHRDRRHRRLRDGRGARDRAVRGRRGGRRDRGHPADVRDHAGRDPDVPGAGARLPRYADRHRRDAGRRAPGSCRTSTPAWPARSPAPARSAPGWSTRRPRSSPPPSRALAELAPPVGGGA